MLDNFSSGGAGQQSDRRGRLLEIEDNIDFQIGKKHRMRTGFLLEGMWYRSDELRNGNGTWTFGEPRQYELGLADDLHAARRHDAGGLQPVSGGVVRPGRLHAVQEAVAQLRAAARDAVAPRRQGNFAPRVGFTWTPGKYTVRGGYGIFNDWYESSIYEQTLRVNGVTQQDLVVQNPGYPDTTGGALANPLPPSQYQAAPGLQMPYLHQASIGVERTLIETLRLMASYTMMRGPRPVSRRQHQRADDRRPRARPARSRWATSPSSSRPGESEIDRLTINVNYAKPERRFFMGANYQLARSNNFSDSAVCAAGQQLRPRGRVGAVAAGRAAPVLRHGELRRADGHAAGRLHAGAVGVALQRHHGLRHQPRHGRQRSARGRGTQLGARLGQLEPERAPEQVVRLRPAAPDRRAAAPQVRRVRRRRSRRARAAAVAAAR